MPENAPPVATRAAPVVRSETVKAAMRNTAAYVSSDPSDGYGLRASGAVAARAGELAAVGRSVLAIGGRILLTAYSPAERVSGTVQDESVSVLTRVG